MTLPLPSRRADGSAPKPMERAPFTFLALRVFDPATRMPDDIARAARFKVVLSNWYFHFSGADREAFRKAGCELFIYLWFNGYYERELGNEGTGSEGIRQFPDMVEGFREIHRHPEWLLNPEKPLQGSGAVHPAFFYDFGNPAFRAHYIGFMRKRLRHTRYNGVFFDYIGSWALPEAVKDLWKKRHPDLTYDEAGVLFLKEMRKALPDVRQFGNQAYRLPEEYYDCVDYDLTESHATSFVWGKETQLYVRGKGMQKVTETFYRPWDGPNGYKEISRGWRERKARHPKVTVFDLNYLQPRYVPTGETASVDGKTVPVYEEQTDRPAIFYGYVLSKLIGTDGYTSDWYAPGYGRDDVWFTDLGKPVSDGYEEAETAVTRYFEKGFVVATRREGETRFRPDPRRLPAGVKGLWDAYAGGPVAGWKRGDAVTIVPVDYPATGSRYPSGRVYLYRR